MWIVFALFSAFSFALIIVIDAFFTERIFLRPWMGTITSSLASILGLLMLPLAWPLTVWRDGHWKIAGAALLAGVLIQVSQVLYFQALADCEAGIVAAYLNLIPVFLPILAFALFGQAFGLWTYVGIALSIASSVWMCLVDGSISTRWHTFWMMAACSLLYAVAALLENYVFDRVPVLEGFVLVTAGIVVCGFIPLWLPSVRALFRANWTVLHPTIGGLIGLEAVNLLAHYFRQRAVSVGDPALIEAVMTIQPGFTFVLSFALFLILPRFGDAQAKENLWLKLLLVGMMVVGVRLIVA